MNTCCASVELTKASLPTQIPMATVKKTVRVAAVQMTSVNDLMANFRTCSRLVQVNQSSLSLYYIHILTKINAFPS